jgi:NAD+ synthase
MVKARIISWIRQQVGVAGARGVVLGLSGGVDSSVAASLCVQALGKNRVLGLFMPCHSHAQDLRDARLIAKKLGIKTRLIDLTAAYEALLRSLPAAGKLAQANLRPRLRMLTLYYFANELDYLVCGTGNKSELMAGYFTKYGDGGADILPIADLLKKDVIKLARALGVARHIIGKPPTAGLWPGQTDEGEMGITYDQLDDILERLEQKRKQIAVPALVNKVRAMIKRSEHKRKSAAVFRDGS